MKKIISLFILAAAQLSAAPALYEGFNAEGIDAGERTGFLSAWHRLQGEVGASPYGLGLEGLSGEPGALILEKKGEALAQVAVDVKGDYFGSFRVRTAELRPDSLLALVFARPDLEELNPKTGTLSLLVTGWRYDHAVIISKGKAEKPGDGVAIEAKQIYLVLFKVKNPGSGPSKATMWILNQAQAEYFAANSLTEDALNSASLGAGESAVMQRISLSAKPGTKLELSKGDVIACMAKFNPKAAFDEIRLSKASLADAAGVKAK